MSHKGISFTGEAGGLVYLVDDAGTRSTSDVFSDMSGDFSMPVFRTGSYCRFNRFLIPLILVSPFR